MVEELSQLNNICLCITSHIPTVPSDCRTPDIPTPSIEAARDAFYRIYENDEWSNLVDNTLDQLDFHPPSRSPYLRWLHIHNKWDTSWLTREWRTRRTSVLRTEHNKRFAATVELLLTSPCSKSLAPTPRYCIDHLAIFCRLQCSLVLRCGSPRSRNSLRYPLYRPTQQHARWEKGTPNGP